MSAAPRAAGPTDARSVAATTFNAPTFAQSASADLPFAPRVIAWQRAHGRHELPWQRTRDAYRLWLSEIMLQQTQVSAVIGYYARFLDRFPTLETLAAASLDDVMACWSGLGYYSRARNLHACAKRVVAEHGGRFPPDPAVLATLPGIGRSTAAAIAAFAYDAHAPILDGNVKRVFARHWGVDGWPGLPSVERALWAIAEREMPRGDVVAYTQGLMDLGAGLCTRTRPACAACPVSTTCVAFATDRTAALPAARPRRAVPVRDAHMLVALHADAVLLEARPPSGIWGGLWSLPQFEDATAVVHAAHALGGDDAAPSLQTLDARKHTFTHFTLRWQPHVLRVAHARPLDAGQAWQPLATLDARGLPAPIRTLLAELARDLPRALDVQPMTLF